MFKIQCMPTANTSLPAQPAPDEPFRHGHNHAHVASAMMSSYGALSVRRWYVHRMSRSNHIISVEGCIWQFRDVAKQLLSPHPRCNTCSGESPAQRGVTTDDWIPDSIVTRFRRLLSQAASLPRPPAAELPEQSPATNVCGEAQAASSLLPVTG
jgi:hypothetical protein